MADEPDQLDITDELIAERRSSGPGDLPDDMPPWMARTISVIAVSYTHLTLPTKA